MTPGKKLVLFIGLRPACAVLLALSPVLVIVTVLYVIKAGVIAAFEEAQDKFCDVKRVYTVLFTGLWNGGVNP